MRTPHGAGSETGTRSTWDEIVDRNLKYVFLTTRAMVRQLLAAGTGGSVVNIASISGETSAPNHTAYGAAKAGLTNLTRTLAVEYGPEQIRFNAVAPGSVATPAVADRVGGTERGPAATLGNAGGHRKRCRLLGFPVGFLHHRTDVARRWWGHCEFPSDHPDAVQANEWRLTQWSGHSEAGFRRLANFGDAVVALPSRC